MRRRALLAALSVALVATFMPVAVSAKTDSLATRVAAANEVLAERTAAQLAHDRARYEATIDPKAPVAFHTAQMAAYDGLASLPLKALSYLARTDQIGDLTRAVTRSEYEDAPVLLVQTSRSLTFDRYDDRASLDDMWWTFVQREGRWYIGGDDDVADLGLITTVSIWDTGPVIAVSNEQFLVVTHPELAERANAVLGLLTSALTTLGPRWPLEWSDRLVVFLPKSPDELSTLIQSTVDVTKFVAFVSYTFDPDALKGTAPRMYLQDANLSLYPAAGQVETLVHELVHAASSLYVSTFVPNWVHEGVADWVAGGTDKAYPRDRGSGTQAPRDDEFGAGGQTDIVRAYRDSRSLISTLAKTAGPNAPYDLFKALGDQAVRPGARAWVLDQSLQSVGVASLTDLQNAWVGK